MRRPAHRRTRRHSPASLWELLDLGAPELTAWMRGGLCAQTGPDEFFPTSGGSVEPAKAICATCPVLMACRTYALEHGERFGVWGGMSTRERRALRRKAAADELAAAVDRLVA